MQVTIDIISFLSSIQWAQDCQEATNRPYQRGTLYRLSIVLIFTQKLMIILRSCINLKKMNESPDKR